MRTGPGQQGRDGDARSGHLAAHPFGVGLDERLRARIAGLTGERVESRGGSDVEDGAAAAGHHLLHRPGGQVDDGLDVEPHLRYLVGDGRFLDRPDGADARVVHEDVDGQAAVGDFVEKACASTGVGDVAGDHLDADGLAELGGEVAQPVLAARDERDAVAAMRQFAGDVGADAR